MRLVSDERLLDVAARFIGPDIALFASDYIAKPPREVQKVLWHQDGTGWPLEPIEVVTLWLALDDVTPENWCKRVLPSIQTLRLLEPDEVEHRPGGDNVLGWGMQQDEMDETRAVDVVLSPGDASVHDPKLIHGSNANTSPRWRRGLTLRYIPTTTRITRPSPFPSACLLRGNDVSVNLYNPWPTYVEGEHMPFWDSAAWNARVKTRMLG